MAYMKPQLIIYELDQFVPAINDFEKGLASVRTASVCVCH